MPLTFSLEVTRDRVDISSCLQRDVSDSCQFQGDTLQLFVPQLSKSILETVRLKQECDIIFSQRAHIQLPPRPLNHVPQEPSPLLLNPRNLFPKPPNRDIDLGLVVPIPPPGRPDPLPQAEPVRVQVRVRLQKPPELRHVGARHVQARSVQGAEGAGDVDVAQQVAVREQLAADDRVEVVPAVPEGPFAAHVGGRVDGGGGLPRQVWGGRRVSFVGG